MPRGSLTLRNARHVMLEIFEGIDGKHSVITLLIDRTRQLTSERVYLTDEQECNLKLYFDLYFENVRPKIDRTAPDAEMIPQLEWALRIATLRRRSSCDNVSFLFLNHS